MKIWKRDHYEKMSMSNKKIETVRDLQDKIQENLAKIEDLQAECKHETYEAVMYSWRPGSYQPSQVCHECRKHLGDATEEESKYLWDKFCGNTDANQDSPVDLTPTVKKRQ